MAVLISFFTAVPSKSKASSVLESISALGRTISSGRTRARQRTTEEDRSQVVGMPDVGQGKTRGLLPLALPAYK
jgi:hypothetical protein